MVVFGVGQDKTTTNSLVQYSVVRINLGEPSPSVERIREVVAKVLVDNSYTTTGKVFE